MNKSGTKIFPGNENDNSVPMKTPNSNVIQIDAVNQEISSKNQKKPKTFAQKSFEFLKENALLVSTIFSVILAIGIGFILREFVEFNENEIDYFGFVGQLFLRMLKFLILPLIGSSLISGIAGLGSGNGGKIALRSLIYYFASTFVAVVIGIILVVSIQPGVGRASESDSSSTVPIDVSRVVTTQDTILDLIRFFNYTKVLKSMINFFFVSLLKEICFLITL